MRTERMEEALSLYILRFPEWISMDWNTMMRAELAFVLISPYLCAMRLTEFCNTSLGPKGIQEWVKDFYILPNIRRVQTVIYWKCNAVFLISHQDSPTIARGKFVVIKFYGSSNKLLFSLSFMLFSCYINIAFTTVTQKYSIKNIRVVEKSTVQLYEKRSMYNCTYL